MNYPQNPPGTSKNQPETLKNHQNPLGTMKNEPGTLKIIKLTWTNKKPTWNLENHKTHLER